MKNFFITIFICSTFISMKDEIKGEYVITAKKGVTQVKVEQILSKRRPDEIKSLGRGKFFIMYKKDPGLEKLQKELKEKLTIQPNYSYKALKN